MKFVCNNCGFSAEVPDRRSNCPMCASSNVSIAALTENPLIQAKQVDDQPEKEDGPAEETVKPVVGTKTGSENKSELPRKEKITLSDDFFDSKPNKEEQEIANILKELYPETGESKNKMVLPGIKVISIGIAVVIILAAGAFFAFSAGPEKNDTAVKEEKSVEKTEEIVKVEEPVEEKVEEKIEEKPVEKVKVEEKIEEKAEIEKEEAVAEKEVQPVKKAEQIKPVEQKKPEVVKQVRKAPEAPKKVPVKQAVPKVNTETFNNFVQAGHKALAEKRYTDALHEYKNASSVNPSNGPIYKFLGIAYAYLQNQEQACVNYRKYIQLSPNAPDKAQVEAFIKACP
ncbi:MAG TPA: hypothetical protein PKG52_02880 [bacterium]|nr:hypothetical protein [bacterium]HPS30729.1 hypothetical protein [bacterium]